MPPNIEQVQAADLWQHRLYLSEVLRSFSSYDVSHQEDWFLIQLNRSFVIGYVRQVLCWAVERRCNRSVACKCGAGSIQTRKHNRNERLKGQ